MPDKYIIIGKNGQVGSQLMSLLGQSAVGYSHNDCDFTKYSEVEKILSSANPKIIFNAAAYTNVDKAEDEYDDALIGNRDIPKVLATYCKQANIPLVHYSTDYVYPGDGEQANKESDSPCPINKYGKSKLAGELKVVESGCKHLIFRTSWVYDWHNKNFLTTMIKLAKERDSLSIVSDQIGAPTYAFDLAKRSIDAANNATKLDEFPSGIYNLCNEGTTSWYEFANEIFINAKNLGMELKIEKVTPIKTNEYPTPAKRPLNSRLDCSKAKSILQIQMPAWKESLIKCMEKVVENTEDPNKRSISC